jgi:DNA-binding NarL/FixJ family response regulator
VIRLLIVDDQQLVRAGLRMLCTSAPDLCVVGEASNGQEAVRQAREAVPDVVLMDLRMPGMDGTEATRRILAESPATHVVVLTTFDDDEHLYPALAAGVSGFLAKDSTPVELLAAIRRAENGDTPFSPGVLRRLVNEALRTRQTTRPPGHDAPALPDLTAREHQVLTLVASGLSNGEIAERLHLGVTTVKTHVASLMTKTNATNRVRLAVFAAQHDLAHPADVANHVVTGQPPHVRPPHVRP